jgi:hypothetical protein
MSGGAWVWELLGYESFRGVAQLVALNSRIVDIYSGSVGKKMILFSITARMCKPITV